MWDAGGNPSWLPWSPEFFNFPEDSKAEASIQEVESLQDLKEKLKKKELSFFKLKDKVIATDLLINVFNEHKREYKKQEVQLTSLQSQYGILLMENVQLKKDVINLENESKILEKKCSDLEIKEMALQSHNTQLQELLQTKSIKRSEQEDFTQNKTKMNTLKAEFARHKKDTLNKISKSQFLILSLKRYLVLFGEKALNNLTFDEKNVFYKYKKQLTKTKKISDSENDDEPDDFELFAPPSCLSTDSGQSSYISDDIKYPQSCTPSIEDTESYRENECLSLFSNSDSNSGIASTVNQALIECSIIHPIKNASISVGVNTDSEYFLKPLNKPLEKSMDTLKNSNVLSLPKCSFDDSKKQTIERSTSPMKFPSESIESNTEPGYFIKSSIDTSENISCVRNIIKQLDLPEDSFSKCTCSLAIKKILVNKATSPIKKLSRSVGVNTISSSTESESPVVDKLSSACVLDNSNSKNTDENYVSMILNKMKVPSYELLSPIQLDECDTNKNTKQPDMTSKRCKIKACKMKKNKMLKIIKENQRKQDTFASFRKEMKLMCNRYFSKINFSLRKRVKRLGIQHTSGHNRINKQDLETQSVNSNQLDRELMQDDCATPLTLKTTLELRESQTLNELECIHKNDCDTSDLCQFKYNTDTQIVNENSSNKNIKLPITSDNCDASISTIENNIANRNIKVPIVEDDSHKTVSSNEITTFYKEIPSSITPDIVDGNNIDKISDDNIGRYVGFNSAENLFDDLPNEGRHKNISPDNLSTSTHPNNVDLDRCVNNQIDNSCDINVNSLCTDDVNNTTISSNEKTSISDNDADFMDFVNIGNASDRSFELLLADDNCHIDAISTNPVNINADCITNIDCIEKASNRIVDLISNDDNLHENIPSNEKLSLVSTPNNIDTVFISDIDNIKKASERIVDLPHDDDNFHEIIPTNEVLTVATSPDNINTDCISDIDNIKKVSDRIVASPPDDDNCHEKIPTNEALSVATSPDNINTDRTSDTDNIKEASDRIVASPPDDDNCYEKIPTDEALSVATNPDNINTDCISDIDNMKKATERIVDLTHDNDNFHETISSNEALSVASNSNNIATDCIANNNINKISDRIIDLPQINGNCHETYKTHISLDNILPALVEPVVIDSDNNNQTSSFALVDNKKNIFDGNENLPLPNDSFQKTDHSNKISDNNIIEEVIINPKQKHEIDNNNISALAKNPRRSARKAKTKDIKDLFGENEDSDNEMPKNNTSLKRTLSIDEPIKESKRIKLNQQTDSNKVNHSELNPHETFNVSTVSKKRISHIKTMDASQSKNKATELLNKKRVISISRSKIIKINPVKIGGHYKYDKATECELICNDKLDGKNESNPEAINKINDISSVSQSEKPCPIMNLKTTDDLNLANEKNLQNKKRKIKLDTTIKSNIRKSILLKSEVNILNDTINFIGSNVSNAKAEQSNVTLKTPKPNTVTSDLKTSDINSECIKNISHKDDLQTLTSFKLPDKINTINLSNQSTASSLNIFPRVDQVLKSEARQAVSYDGISFDNEESLIAKNPLKTVVDESLEDGSLYRKFMPLTMENKVTDLFEILVKHLTVEITEDSLAKLIENIYFCDEHILADAIVMFIGKDLKSTGTVTHIPCMPVIPYTHQACLCFMKKLHENPPAHFKHSIYDTVLNSIDYKLFNLKNVPNTHIYGLTAKYYAIICHITKQRDRLKFFCVDALYCLSFAAIPVIYSTLEVWPFVLPKASYKIAKDPLVVVMVHLMIKISDKDKFKKMRRKSLPNNMDIKKLLCSQKYGYQSDEYNDDQILQYLTTLLKDAKPFSSNKSLIFAFLLFGKRCGAEWCHKRIIINSLLPIIDDKTSSNETKALAIQLIGPLIRPFPLSMLVHCEIVIKKLILILRDGATSLIEEAIVYSLIYLSRKDYQLIIEVISKWQPKTPISAELKNALKKLVLEKNYMFWKTNKLFDD